MVPNPDARPVFTDGDTDRFGIAYRCGNNSANIGGALLDKILVVSNTMAYGYSSQNSSLYQISIPGLVLNPASFPGIPALGITGIASSNEVPNGQRMLVHNLYILCRQRVSGNLTNGQVSGTVLVSTAQVGVIAVTNVASATTRSTPVTLLQYGTIRRWPRV